MVLTTIIVPGYTGMNDLFPGNVVTGRKVKAVLFDMDNTLFDLAGAKMEACRRVACHFGREDGNELFDYFTRPLWGFEDWRNIRDYLVERDIFTIPGYFEACNMYETEKMNRLVVYPGVSEVLDNLTSAGIPLAILTDADMPHAKKRLRKTGLLEAFDCLVTFEMTGRKKPDHAPLLHALKKLGRVAGETVMVGDSPDRDLIPAGELGMLTIYARYGDRFADTRDKSVSFTAIDTIRDLPALLAPLIT